LLHPEAQANLRDSKVVNGNSPIGRPSRRATVRTRHRRLGIVTAWAIIIISLIALRPPSANARPGLPMSAPGVLITPTAGNASTAFNLSAGVDRFLLPGFRCSPERLTNGYEWQTFIVSAGVDPGVLFYDAFGPTRPASTPSDAVVQPLYTRFGSPIAGQTTSGPDGVIVGIPTMSFAANTLPDGIYKLGFACTQPIPGQGSDGSVLRMSRFVLKFGGDPDLAQAAA